MQSKVVLIVDDEEGPREILRFDLEMFGCQVQEAGSMAEAMSIFKSNKPDLVISDVRMPNGSGIDLAKAVRELDIDIPIAFLTGYSDVKKESIQELSILKVLKKPYDVERDLGGMLEKVFSR